MEKKTVLYRPRFVKQADMKLREAVYRRGELVELIVLILTTVDLATVPLMEFGADIQKLATTTVQLPSTLHAKLKRMATKRQSSMNHLLNSAVVAYDPPSENKNDE